MITRMYQVRDKVARCMQGPIICERSDPPAIRMFYQACADPNGQLGKYPRDFEMVCLGEIDDTDGSLVVPEDRSAFPAVVATGVQYLADLEAAK